MCTAGDRLERKESPDVTKGVSYSAERRSEKKKFEISFSNFEFYACRLVSSPARQNEAGSSSSGATQHAATFAVRVGTIDGVVTHHLRAETRRDLAAWARAIVQGCHAAAHSLREYTVRK